MKCKHEKGSGPIDRFRKCFVPFDEVHDPNLARASEGFCNSCVIPPMEFPKILRQEFLDSTHLLHQTCTYGQRCSRYVAAAPRDLFHIT
jgi:hypothetical protein